MPVSAGTGGWHFASRPSKALRNGARRRRFGLRPLIDSSSSLHLSAARQAPSQDFLFHLLSFSFEQQRVWLLLYPDPVVRPSVPKKKFSSDDHSLRCIQPSPCCSSCQCHSCFASQVLQQASNVHITMCLPSCRFFMKISTHCIESMFCIGCLHGARLYDVCAALFVAKFSRSLRCDTQGRCHRFVSSTAVRGRARRGKAPVVAWRPVCSRQPEGRFGSDRLPPAPGRDTPDRFVRSGCGDVTGESRERKRERESESPSFICGLVRLEEAKSVDYCRIA